MKQFICRVSEGHRRADAAQCASGHAIWGNPGGGRQVEGATVARLKSEKCKNKVNGVDFQIYESKMVSL